MDPEQVVRFAAATILGRAGYEVLPTADWGKTVEMIRADTPPLVLADVCLSHVTCQETVQLSRQRCPDLPLLMVLGFAGLSVFTRCRKDGNFEMLNKPYKAFQLRAKVKKLLGPPTAAAASFHSHRREKMRTFL